MEKPLPQRPFSCRRQYVKVAGIICLVAGIVLLIYAAVTADVVSGGTKVAEIAQANNIFLLILLVLGAVLIFVGLCGWCGSSRKNITCIRWFQNFNIGFLVVFALLTVAAGVVHFNIISDLNDGARCRNNYFVSKVNKWYALAHQIFAQNGCPAYAQDPSAFADLGLALSADPTAAQSVYDCGDFETQSRSQFAGNYSSIIKSLEQDRSCSGMCDYYGFYLFSGINRGVPAARESCSVSLYQMYRSRTLAYFVLTCATLVFLFANVTIALYLQRKRTDTTELDDDPDDFAQKQSPDRAAKYREVQMSQI